MKRLFLLALGAVGCATRPPNVVFVLADDLGYGDLGAYGQKTVRTPNLDRLATEGMKFRQFYSGSTVCAPSRCVLMTGRHTGHCSVRSNSREATNHDLRPAESTIAEVMKKAGYATAAIGKWGLGEEGSPSLPTSRGFDRFYGYLNQVHAHNYYPAFLWRNGSKDLLHNEVVTIGKPTEGDHYVAERATKAVDWSPALMLSEAQRWIDEVKDRPFFLYLATILPHGGNGQVVPDLGPYANESWPEGDKSRAALVTRMDTQVGDLLRHLRARGLDRDTIVMFSGDNGPSGGKRFDPAGGLRGNKGTMYEGGIRVPLIVRWPGVVAAGSVSDHVGYFGDVMATLAEVAGVAPPKDVDSLSFVPALRGQAQAKHEYLYWEYYEGGSPQAVRFETWKAIRVPMHTGPVQLYDLASDPAESRDLAAEKPEVVARAVAHMQAAHTDDPRWKPRKGGGGE